MRCWPCVERSAWSNGGGKVDAEWLRRKLEGRVRAELLSETLFMSMSIANASVELAARLEGCNVGRPQSSLEYASSPEFVAELEKMACFAASYGLRYLDNCHYSTGALRNRPALIPAGGKLGNVLSRLAISASQNASMGQSIRALCKSPKPAILALSASGAVVMATKAASISCAADVSRWQ